MPRPREYQWSLDNDVAIDGRTCGPYQANFGGDVCCTTAIQSPAPPGMAPTPPPPSPSPPTPPEAPPPSTPTAPPSPARPPATPFHWSSMEEGVCYFVAQVPLTNPPDGLNFMDSCVPASASTAAQSKWRLGGAMAGQCGRVWLHVKAWGSPPHSGGRARLLRCHREAVAMAPRPIKSSPMPSFVTLQASRASPSQCCA